MRGSCEINFYNILMILEPTQSGDVLAGSNGDDRRRVRIEISKLIKDERR